MNDQRVFTNEAVNIDKLPTLANLQQQPISPRYATANRYINLLSILVLSCIGLFLQYQTFFSVAQSSLDLMLILSLAIAALGFLLTAYQSKADQYKFYALREQDISYSSGLIFKKTVCQPLLRVQHVELKRGPIDRKIGLGKLQVFSAGGAMYTFAIPGLELKDAQRLRNFILNDTSINCDD